MVVIKVPFSVTVTDIAGVSRFKFAKDFAGLCNYVDLMCHTTKVIVSEGEQQFM